MSDDRIGEGPPALEGELFRWQDVDGDWCAVDSRGIAHYGLPSCVPGRPGDELSWWVQKEGADGIYGEAARRLAAALAAYRERRDEGNVAAAVEAAYREGWDAAANAGDFDFIDNVDELREDNWSNSEACALLARRAATPAGGEGAGGDGNEETT